MYNVVVALHLVVQKLLRNAVLNIQSQGFILVNFQGLGSNTMCLVC